MPNLKYHAERNRQMRWASEAYKTAQRAENALDEACARLAMRIHVRKARKAWHIAIGLRDAPKVAEFRPHQPPRHLGGHAE